MHKGLVQIEDEALLPRGLGGPYNNMLLFWLQLDNLAINFIKNGSYLGSTAGLEAPWGTWVTKEAAGLWSDFLDLVSEV